MASSSLKNISSLFKETRSRTIIIVTIFILIVSIIYGAFILRDKTSGPESASVLSGSPRISSIPGSISPSETYARLQTQENIEKAQRALQTGTSAIPTVVQTQQFGRGEGLSAVEPGSAGLGFSSLSQSLQFGGGLQKPLWLDELKENNCSLSAIQEAVEQGATLETMIDACSCAQLKAANFDANALKAVCSVGDLRTAGFSALELKNAGFTATSLREVGFDACQLSSAGYNAAELRAAGFSDGELRGAGFTERDIKIASGLPDGISVSDIQKAGCNVDELRRLRTVGVSAEAIRQISGCEAIDLKAAGFNAQEMHASGYSSAQLIVAGYSPREVVLAGYTAQELIDADITAESLKNLDLSADQLKIAGFSAKQLADAGYTVDTLKAAGYSSSELALAEITASDLSDIECTPEMLSVLRSRGVSAEAIKAQANCSIGALKQAGFTVLELHAAGYSNNELAAVGFTALELEVLTANSDIMQKIRDSNCSVDSIAQARLLGVSADMIRRAAGCAAAALRSAGYSAAELRQAGYSAAELKQAGFSLTDLRLAGFNARELANTGISTSELRTAGFDIEGLKDAGFSANELLAAGFNAKQLKDADFTAEQLLAAGFDTNALKEAGFTASQLRDIGVSIANLSTANFSIDQLRSAGFNQQELQNAGLEMRSLPASQPQITTTAATSVSQRDEELKEILARQAEQMSELELQQRIQQRASLIRGRMVQLDSAWESPTQSYIATEINEENEPGMSDDRSSSQQLDQTVRSANNIKAGDILFAVLDTAVNTDEPGPILATIVSGKFKGAKLIGSLSLPAQAQKVIISFNRMSIIDAPNTISISAVAIDPDTARTALSSHTDNHYLLRYGSLFASRFLEGVGSAISTSGTEVLLPETGSDIIIRNTKRSTTEAALIGLGQLGQSWGEAVRPLFNRPPTVQVYSGTGMGILFTNDVSTSLPEQASNENELQLIR